MAEPNTAGRSKGEATQRMAPHRKGNALPRRATHGKGKALPHNAQQGKGKVSRRLAAQRQRIEWRVGAKARRSTSEPSKGMATQDVAKQSFAQQRQGEDKPGTTTLSNGLVQICTA